MIFQLKSDDLWSFARQAAELLNCSVIDVLWTIPGDMTFAALAAVEVDAGASSFDKTQKEQIKMKTMFAYMDDHPEILADLREKRKEIGTERPTRGNG